MNARELTEKYEQYVIDTRRDFHMHPELSLKEDRTVRRIEEELGGAAVYPGFGAFNRGENSSL